jgi:hypothetical protein
MLAGALFRKGYMHIDSREVIRFIDSQIDMFNLLPFKGDYQKGIIDALEMVKIHVEYIEDKDGNKLAEQFGE